MARPKLTALLVVISLASMLAEPTMARTGSSPLRPNFLVIVADDLGFSDLGAFGGEIATPNLDALAYDGIRMVDFHTATWCTPTRAMLLSGTDSNLALAGSGWPYLRPDALSLAELLADAGYWTLFSGKWHLGVTAEQDPHRRGFRRSFALLEGEHNHFGMAGRTLPTTYTEDGHPFTTLPDDFYSSDYFASRLIDYLRESKGRAGVRRQPFFAYLAFSAPHGPQQALREDIARYHGRYDAGFDALKETRLARQKELGLLRDSVVPHAPLFWTGYPIGAPTVGRWNTWSDEQRQIAARDMEIYAAMVDRLDQNVGRVLATLREMGELDHTVILFLSDNGARGAAAGVFTEASLEAGLKGKGSELVKELVGLSGADNRLDNRGSASSWVRYAPGWAEAASAPSWLYKSYATEGGTRVAAFLNLPGSYRKGEIAKVYLSVADVLPTFLDLAGVPQPTRRYRGRSVQPVMGRSWTAWLEGASPQVYGPDDAVGRADPGGSGTYALRRGDWKITDVDGNGRWLLFNIAVDPGETEDLSDRYPQRKTELLADWEIYSRNVALPLHVRPALKSPLNEQMKCECRDK